MVGGTGSNQHPLLCESRIAINDAAASAKLPAATCAYTLRHCVITDLIVGGLDLFHIAKIRGTSIAMIEKNYGHLQPGHTRDALKESSM
jgi:site-specific recombinase XerD